MLRTEKSAFFDDFLRALGLLYLTYCARTVAENGEKDAFSVISDNEWNPYLFFTLYQNSIKKSIVSKRNQVTNLLSGNRKVTFMKKIF